MFTDKIIGNRGSLFVTVVLVFLLVACGAEMTKEGARKKLSDLDVEYSRENFINRVTEGDEVVVDLFIKSGMKLNVKSRINERTPLLIAALNGHRYITNRLIEFGADVNFKDKNGVNALMIAAVKGHSNILEILLEAGADVNEKNDDGQTALMASAIGGHFNITENLIEAGADVNEKANDGGTALFFACLTGQNSIVNILLSNGAKLNITGGVERPSVHTFGYYNEQMTPLMAAVYREHVEVVKNLLKAGAKVNFKAENSKTALDLAKRGRHSELVNLLKKHGGKPGR